MSLGGLSREEAAESKSHPFHVKLFIVGHDRSGFDLLLLLAAHLSDLLRRAEMDACSA